MPRSVIAPVLLAALVLGWQCETEASPSPLERLSGAAVVEVLSLDPEPGDPNAEGIAPARKPGPAFHGWPYLDRSSSVSAADQKALLAQLRRMLGSPQDVAYACFQPRHGLRLHGPAGDLDVVICFECASLEIFEPDGTRIDSVSFGRANAELWYKVYGRSGIKRQLRPYQE
jgi:hypothetical protein